MYQSKLHLQKELLEQFQKLLLRGVAVLVFPDEIAVSAGRRELDALGHQTKLRLLERVIEFDEGESPVVLVRRDEGRNDGGLALAVAGGEIVGNEIAERDAAAREGRQ